VDVTELRRAFGEAMELLVSETAHADAALGERLSGPAGL